VLATQPSGRQAGNFNPVMTNHNMYSGKHSHDDNSFIGASIHMLSTWHFLVILGSPKSLTGIYVDIAFAFDIRSTNCWFLLCYFLFRELHVNNVWISDCLLAFLLVMITGMKLLACLRVGAFSDEVDSGVV
jgi:hypothetical protein